VLSPFGIQLTLDGKERLNALAALDWTVNRSQENESVKVTLADSGSWPITFHYTYELGEGSSEILIETKALNRSLDLAYYNAGLIFPPDMVQIESVGQKGASCFAGLAADLILRSVELGAVQVRERGVSATRFQRPRVIAARQLDTWSVSLAVIAKTSALPILGKELCVSLQDAQLTLQSSVAIDPLKILVATASGETLEANLTVRPDSPITIPLREQDVPLQGIIVLDRDRRELIRYEAGQVNPTPNHTLSPDEIFYSIPRLASSEDSLRKATFDVRTRALAHHLISIRAIEAQDFREASFHLEQSLLYNGEDHLTWWLKSRCETLADPLSTGGDELLNAHYLAPLDPILKAEALLNQPNQPGNDPNPILQPLAEDRDAILLTSGELIQAGLLNDASRLIGEWLRLQDFPMLRYLLAYCFLKGTRMKIEAGAQLKAAAASGFIAPFPVRPVEIEVLRTLAEEWPQDPHLGQYHELAQVFLNRSLEKAIQS
jgi:hypothetical protein